MAKLDISDSLSVGEVTLSDLECKLVGKKRKADAKSSFVVPLTLENEKLYALVDTGCTFSSIDKRFVNKRSFVIEKEHGTITLAANGMKLERIGKTKKLEILVGL
ncbi:hypothetical protein [Absidia glauca]|uniref:Peptidase A2 domain-containing protein n=1 Tax=Absidia glauca TaxID=4829 RepID=A0A168R705_ABSGL|nr:hypothetical protein [Absidia glauca]